MAEASPRRSLPSVKDVLEHEALLAWRGRVREDVRANAARRAVAELRGRLAEGGEAGRADRARLRAEAARSAAAHLDFLLAPRPKRVLNATGVVLHTNLGRAPLGRAALAAAASVEGYVALELDLETGERGNRNALLDDLLAAATGAEAAIAVNNNAGGVLLALAALAADGEVIVSRGELVEIGGSFRVPDVMAASGARLVEVGTTNRTRLADYERRLSPGTKALLKVHRSNFTISGFTSEASLEELAGLARSAGLPLLYDLGSGAPREGIAGVPRDEPTVAGALAAGADLVMFSADKLLGGPQAGILAGRRELVATASRHPLYRALRLGKLSVAALAATLQEHIRAADGRPSLPAHELLSRDEARLSRMAGELAELVRAAVGDRAEVDVARGVSPVGGGSAPGSGLPAVLVRVRPRDVAAHALAARLRGNEPAVIARVGDERLLLDPRTLFEDELPALAQAVGRALGHVSPA